MALLTNDIQKDLKTLLIEEGLVGSSVIDEYEKRASVDGAPFVSILLKDGIVSDETMTHCIAHVSGVPYVNLADVPIDQKILGLLPLDIAERFMAVPLGEVSGRLAVAMLDANNIQAVDFLANKIARPLKVYMASEAGIRNVIAQYKTDFSNVDAAVDAIQSEKDAAAQVSGDVKTIVQDSPISRALSTILEHAVRSRASDIHIEPMETQLKIRNRVDGVLR